MTKYFNAGPEHGVATTQNMDPPGPQPVEFGVKSGVMKLHLSVYEPDDKHQPHESLPTLGELLAENIDPDTGLLTYEIHGVTLTMDSKPLRELPAEYLGYRVSPGCSFVTHEALRRADVRRPT